MYMYMYSTIHVHVHVQKDTCTLYVNSDQSSSRLDPSVFAKIQYTKFKNERCTLIGYWLAQQLLTESCTCITYVCMQCGLWLAISTTQLLISLYIELVWTLSGDGALCVLNFRPEIGTRWGYHGKCHWSMLDYCWINLLLLLFKHCLQVFNFFTLMVRLYQSPQ